MHAVTLIWGEGRGARVNVSLFWTVFKSKKKKKKHCSSSVLDNRQTWFIWGKKVVLRFFSVNLENYGHRLKSVSTEFLKLWALCKIYNRWAKKERFPTAKPILFKQTVTTITCNLSASVFCSRLFTQIELNISLYLMKQKLSKKNCVPPSIFFGGLVIFLSFILNINKYPISLHWHSITKCIQLPSTILNSQRSSV